MLFSPPAGCHPLAGLFSSPRSPRMRSAFSSGHTVVLSRHSIIPPGWHFRLTAQTYPKGMPRSLRLPCAKQSKSACQALQSVHEGIRERVVKSKMICCANLTNQFPGGPISLPKQAERWNPKMEKIKIYIINLKTAEMLLLISTCNLSHAISVYDEMKAQCSVNNEIVIQFRNLIYSNFKDIPGLE